MERLTANNNDGTAYFLECFREDGCRGEGCKKDDCYFLTRACKKLAEYEDLEEKLQSVYGECNGLLECTVDYLVKHEGVKIGNPIKVRLLTDKDLEHYNELKLAEESGRLIELPEIKKYKTLYWIWAGEIMPVKYFGISHLVYDNQDRKYHVMCHMRTKKDRTFYYEKRNPITIKAGDERCFYVDDIGKGIHFTREAAEAKLKEMEGKE